jgi:hypothetical protein
MHVPFTRASEPLPSLLLRAVLTMGIAGLFCCPSFAGDSSVRELDAYCVSADGTRSGVAASQDGATNTYVWPHGADIKIIRSTHSRRTVSAWHAELDQTGFERLTSLDIPPPYCAIGREQEGQLHVVRWPEGQTPPSFAAVFAAMLAGSPMEIGSVR